jgi:hypothetical protein
LHRHPAIIHPRDGARGCAARQPQARRARAGQPADEPGPESAIDGVRPDHVVIGVQPGASTAVAAAVRPGQQVTLWSVGDGTATVIVPRVTVVRVERDRRETPSAVLVQATPADAGLIAAADQGRIVIGIPGSTAPITPGARTDLGARSARAVDVG